VVVEVEKEQLIKASLKTFFAVFDRQSIASIAVFGCVDGRTVAEVLFDTSEGERSVQEEMLRAGFAYHYKQFSSSCHNSDVFDTAEAIGRSQQRGVWKLQGGGQRPWDYRKQNQS
jgi:hypothetical protein